MTVLESATRKLKFTQNVNFHTPESILVSISTMKHVFISHFAILIAFVSVVNSCSRSVSENSKFDTTFEQGASTYKQWSCDSNQQIADLKEAIAERNESQKLFYQSNSAETSFDYKNEIIELNAQVGDLQRQLDNVDGTKTPKLKELSQKVQTLTSQVNDLTTRILHYDTILDIHNNRFEATEEKMEKFKDDFLTQLKKNRTDAQINGKHSSDPNLEDIKERSRLYHEEILEFASRIHNKYKHGMGSAEDTQTIAMLKKELPKSLSVLAFSSDHVYIKNNYFNQFLEAYASSRFRVPSIEFDKIGSWRLEKDEDHWNIENNSNNEFLFYSDAFSQLPELRTSTKSLDTEWQIFFQPDGVQFMHKSSSKFLCADMEEYEAPDQWYHYLALWGTEEQNFLEWCTWEIMPREN